MAKTYPWEDFPDEKLLRLRLSDLGLRIASDSRVARCRDRLYGEIAARGLNFRPHLWIGDDWYSPDGIPGFAVPFFLIHRRLVALTKEQLYEVEGDSEDWCMRLMRHETAHALDNAFRLRRLKQRQKIFGLASTPYPESYSPKPYSKKYVVNLRSWYAQAHPEEDWAETFAVWLNPKSRWRLRYPKGVVREKLDYVDEVMRGLKGRRPLVRSKETPDEIGEMHQTLGAYFKKVRKQYSLDGFQFFDRDLLRVFSKDDAHKFHPRADRFLRAERPEIRDRVANWTGYYQYAVNDIINELIRRSSELDLHLRGGVRKTRMDVIAMLSARTAVYLSDGEYKIYL